MFTAQQNQELKSLRSSIDQARKRGRITRFDKSIKARVLALHDEGLSLSVLADTLALAPSLLYTWRTARQGPTSPHVLQVADMKQPEETKSKASSVPAVEIRIGHLLLTIAQIGA